MGAYIHVHSTWAIAMPRKGVDRGFELYTCISKRGLFDRLKRPANVEW